MANVYNSQLDAFTLYHNNEESHSSSAISTALPALGHALSGATGTAISNLCIYPLDLIITRLQVQRALSNTNQSSTSTSLATPKPQKYTSVLDAFQKIYNEEGGLSALYSGVLQDTSKSIADSFLFFLFYGYIRTQRLHSHNSTSKDALPVLEELGVGALAGAISKFFTTPLANVVVRKQTHSMTSNSNSKSPSLSSIAQSIMEKKGLAGFWSGYSASLILTLNPSLTFFLFEFFKKSLVPSNRRSDPGTTTTFLLAAMSKAIASSITYPFSLAKSRAQVSGHAPVRESTMADLKSDVNAATDSNTSKKDIGKAAEKHLKDVGKQAKRNSVFGLIARIYREEGLGALYEGIGGEILKGFLGHGLTMIVKDRVHEVILSLYFWVLKTLKKMPSKGDVQEMVTEGAEKTVEKIKEGGEGVMQGARGVGEKVMDGAKNIGDRVGLPTTAEQVNAVGTNVTETAKSAANKAVDAGKDMSGKITSSVADKTEGFRETTGVVGENITEKAARVDDYTRKEAGHLLGNAGEQLGGKVDLGREKAGNLLGNAGEMLGGKIEGVGRGVKEVSGGGKGGGDN
ncbi:mitochondrial carrier protein [Rutstroemia sp. NJR-2017a WRK4]|nr:mitochondrial carrier protein [Rutstroemia sp. NJR-2017a WRK4]